MPYADKEAKRARDRMNFNLKYLTDAEFVQKEAERKNRWYLERRGTPSVRPERFEKVAAEIDAIIKKLELTTPEEQKKLQPDIKRLHEAAKAVRTVARRVTG